MPNGVPQNLLPFVTQTAAGIREQLSVYGNDYNTVDGTPVRDYIHIKDLVDGHIICLSLKGLHIYNLGSGIGYSVKQVLDTFKKVKGIEFDYQYADRREGDIDVMTADISKIREELRWIPKYTLEDICRDV